jgi:hypothetical protein
MIFSCQPAEKHSKVPKRLKEICGFADVAWFVDHAAWAFKHHKLVGA